MGNGRELGIASTRPARRGPAPPRPGPGAARILYNTPIRCIFDVSRCI